MLEHIAGPIVCMIFGGAVALLGFKYLPESVKYRLHHGRKG